jgi:hypothetical protein
MFSGTKTSSGFSSFPQRFLGFVPMQTGEDSLRAFRLVQEASKKDKLSSST